MEESCLSTIKFASAQRICTVVAAVVAVVFCHAVALAGTTVVSESAGAKPKAAKSYIYRYTLKDKQGCTYSLAKPLAFLSAKALERRKRQGLEIDSTDLPVSSAYTRRFNVEGARLVGTSRWNNTVIVSVSDTDVANALSRLSCVRAYKMVWQSPDSILPQSKRLKYHTSYYSWDSIPTSLHAAAKEQIATINGLKLHRKGFLGKGITIAVLDGGFMNADSLPAFAHTSILGMHDFVNPSSQDGICQETDHGTKVLSAMAANAPNVYVGCAPDASYWLLRCEDRQTEQPVEEDYWAMAAEFADSVGVDMINSSLGYYHFDNKADDYRYRDMDGHTTFISRTASMLAGKGIILVNSAGNSGMGPWKKITFPADAEDIITVGALTPTMANAPFSGVGPTQDGRVKPDVMAPGSPASLISGRGTVVQDMGTSFATPLVCGMTACLWQAFPMLTAREIIQIVRQSADNSDQPNNVFGYGVADFGKAFDMGQALQRAKTNSEKTWTTTGD